MQNKYVADAGDFGKHGLLRRLCGMTDEETDVPDLRLGLLWYMHREEHGQDGKHITYLAPTYENIQTFGVCDPALWDALRRMICDDRRCVRCVQGAGILPGDTCFYDALLTFLPGLPRTTKETIRGYWLKRALQATAKADLVCLDPDNGIRWDGSKMLNIDGPKYTYLDDLRAFWDRGQSLVVYHHLGMSVPAEAQAETVSSALVDGLGVESIPLQFHRGTARIFFVLPQPAHRERIEARIQRMLDGPWSHHFERVAA